MPATSSLGAEHGGSEWSTPHLAHSVTVWQPRPWLRASGHSHGLVRTYTCGLGSSSSHHGAAQEGQSWLRKAREPMGGG